MKSCGNFLVASTTAILLTLLNINVDQVSSDFIDFQKTLACDLDARLNADCAELQQGVFRTIECAATCGENESCLAVSEGEDHSCYHHYNCSQAFLCDSGQPKFYLYLKSRNFPPCRHGGIFNSAIDKCECVGGWVGEHCEKIPNSCQELSDNGYPTGFPEGKHWIDMHLEQFTELVRVKCYREQGFTNTLLMNNVGRTSHNMTWDDYVHGYIHGDNDFWVGLEKIKALNDMGYNLLFLDTFFYRQETMNMFQYRYDGFHMSGESTGFNFTYTKATYIETSPWNASLEQENCFQDLQGVPFSTFDNDNDQNSFDNCAAQAGVGWWFTDCNMKCNPLGWIYEVKSDGPAIEHLFMAGLNYSQGSDASGITTFMYFQTY